MINCVKLEIKVVPKDVHYLKDFLQKLNLKNSTMVILSEGCYEWLKTSPSYLTPEGSRIFIEHNVYNNSKAYIDTVNIDSTTCSFIKTVVSQKRNYKYSANSPQKVVIVILEDEKQELPKHISAYTIMTDPKENPVQHIIDMPDFFDNSIVLLTASSYYKLKKNATRISNNYNYERLVWVPDDSYPGGNIMLDILNYGDLYLLCNMAFPFLTKSFCFKKFPTSIYFIS